MLTRLANRRARKGPGRPTRRLHPGGDEEQELSSPLVSAPGTAWAWPDGEGAGRSPLGRGWAGPAVLIGCSSDCPGRPPPLAPLPEAPPLPTRVNPQGPMLVTLEAPGGKAVPRRPCPGVQEPLCAALRPRVSWRQWRGRGVEPLLEGTVGCLFFFFFASY